MKKKVARIRVRKPSCTCGNCRKCWRNNDYERHRERRKAARRAHYYANKTAVTEQNRAWRAENPRKVRSCVLRRNYGISIEEYETVLKKQSGVCAICGEPETHLDYRTGCPRRLAVDHCHRTKRVRGLLCMNCNQGLGKFKEIPDRLRAAIAYLTQNRSR